jgi:hypothetical protein
VLPSLARLPFGRRDGLVLASNKSKDHTLQCQAHLQLRGAGCVHGGMKSLRRATEVSAALLAVGVMPHTYSLIDYARLMSSETATDFPWAIDEIMLLFCVLTHASAIYPLVRFLHFKSISQSHAVLARDPLNELVALGRVWR